MPASIDGSMPRVDRNLSRRVCSLGVSVAAASLKVTRHPRSRGGSPVTERSASRVRRPVAVDVFSGVGGLCLGFEQAGFDVVAAVEYDPIHALTHRYNFRDCEVLCRDVRQIGAPEIRAAARLGFKRKYPNRRWQGTIEALIGGPSCQGFSAGGIRQEDDERNDLLLEFVRLVEEIRPEVFCFENVPGLLEPRFDDLRNRAMKRLRDAGYAVTGSDGWLNAADYGVPQTRKRVVVLGVLDGPPIDLPSPHSQRITVAEALEGLPIVEDYAQLLSGDTARLKAADVRRRGGIATTYARELAGVESSLGVPAGWNPAEVSNSLRVAHSPEVVARFQATTAGTVEPVSRLYRLSEDAQARTLRAGTGRERGAHTSPRPIHPTLPRVITVREAARLHSFPDWFRFNATNWHGHRQVGNSVPPALARAVGEMLYNRLRGSTSPTVSLARIGQEEWRTMSPSEAARVMGAVEAELPPQRARRVAE